MNEMKKLPTSTQSTVLRFAIASVVLGISGCAEIQQQMQQPGYYNLPAASSTTDAISQAESSYATQGIRAPNQIQFDLRQPQSNANRAPAAAPASNQAAAPTTYKVPAASNAASNAAPTTSTTDAPPADLGSQQSNQAATDSNANTLDSYRASLIPEPQTFFGTLPCFHPDMKCTAQRITLSIAPNGRWRARASYLEQGNQNGPNQVDQGCWRATPMNPPRIVLLNAQGGIRAEMAVPSIGNSMRLISINGDAPNLVYTLTRQPDLDPIDELNKVAAPNCP